MTAKSFSVNISQETLDHLRHRLAKTRLPDEVEDADWDYGTNLDYLKELVRYWQNDFDWRSREAELNCFNHFQTEIDDCKIHFIHEKGAGANPIPLLLTHGYPDSFSRFQKIIPLLTEEKDGVSFDVVVPSIPGYGFSDKPKEKGMLLRTFRKIFCRRRANSSSDFSTSSVGRRCHAVDILPPLKNRNC